MLWPVEIVEGGHTLLVCGEADANHTRCSVCVSLPYSVVRDGAWARRDGFARGRAEHPADRAHLRGSRAPWFDITDDLPQNEEL